VADRSAMPGTAPASAGCVAPEDAVSKEEIYKLTQKVRCSG
jgi:hypothetical protein